MIPVKAIKLIKKYESLKLVAYLCPAGVWTVGFGATGPAIVAGLVWTEEQANQRLIQDVDKFAQGVAKICPESTPLQHGAMVCLAFNIGLGAFKKSSVARLHKQKKYAEAAQAFGLWNKAGGKVLKGLVKRRAEEAAMYLEGCSIEPQAPGPTQAEGERPSRTIAGASIGGGAVVASQAADIANQLTWVQEQLVGLAPYLPMISNALVVVGLIGIGVALWARIQDKRSGRS
jgi:lysozyme